MRLKKTILNIVFTLSFVISAFCQTTTASKKNLGADGTKGALSLERKKYLILNVGSSEQDHYSSFEEGISEFQKRIFGNQALYMNAGGLGTKKRNSEVSTLRGAIPGKADAEGIRKILGSIANERPDKFSMVVLGHGTPEGTAVWDGPIWRGSSMGSVDYKNARKQFPPQTIIQELFIHCYSLAAIVESNPPLPKSPLGLYRFLGERYNGKHCGLAYTREDQFGWELKSQQYKQLLTHSNISLSQLKQNLLKVSETMPALTSDSLLMDLDQFMCQSGRTATTAAASASASAPNDESAGHGAEQTLMPVGPSIVWQGLTAAQFKEMCDSSPVGFRDELVRLEAPPQLMGIRRYFSDQQFSKDEPKKYSEYSNIKIEISNLEREADGMTDVGARDRILEEIEKLDAKFIKTSKELKELADDTERFQKIIPNCETMIKKYEKDEELPKKYPLVFALCKANPKSGIFQLESTFFDQRAVSMRLKKMRMTMENNRKKVLEPWIKDKAPEFVRSLYEQLKRCENLPFN